MDLPHEMFEFNQPAEDDEQDDSRNSAAITSPWSNGQTEGQITRLKLIKRQMYGRAKLDLLQARMIGSA